MVDAVLLSACRTAIGTARRGTLRDTDAFELATTVVREAARRSGLPPETVDDVVLGESPAGGGDIARYAALQAGLTHVPGLAHNRHCASGLASVATAAASVRAGMDRVVIAGGTHSSSTAPVARRRIPGTDDWQDPWMAPTHVPTPEAPNDDMGVLVGWNTARLAGLTRREMDAWALRSHERAVRAIDEGRFTEEIVPVKVAGRDGATVVFDTDEHPRRDTSAEKLAALKVLHPELEGFFVHQHRARTGRQQPGEYGEQRALSRPVGADQPDHRGRRHRHIDLAQGDETAEADGDAPGLDASRCPDGGRAHTNSP